jgi:hypothetical protein
VAIRFVDAPGNLARISVTLGSDGSAILGTNVSPAGRSGVIGSQLAPTSCLIVAALSAAPGRTGQISTALGGATGLLTSTSSFVGFLWEPATQNTDGSAITAGEVTGYEVGIRQGGTAGTYPTIIAVSGAFTALQLISAITPPLSAGTYIAAVRSVGPINSPWSTEFTFTV